MGTISPSPWSPHHVGRSVPLVGDTWFATIRSPCIRLTPWRCPRSPLTSNRLRNPFIVTRSHPEI